MINDYIQNEKVELMVKQVAKDNAPYCGDSYFFITTDEYFLLLLADGLGSGKNAYDSSNTVKEIVEEHHHLPVEEIMDKCNKGLNMKRGAAVALIKFFFDTKSFHYLSVGNIRFFIYLPSNEKTLYPLPESGYLSGSRKVFKSQTFQYEPSSLFVIYSDGLELKGIKSHISRNISLKAKADSMWDANVAPSDDVTFILGSLLS
ncbi:MAG: PP2C family serine/threonine-protein phosphatase [Bacillus sp. (in: firmicutes)]